MTFVTPEIKQLYVNIIDQLRTDIGRNVDVISPPSTIDCPNCGWDPINKSSNNKYEPDDPYPTATLVGNGNNPVGPVNFPALGQRKCPVCGGRGVIDLTGNTSQVVCLINPLSPVDAEKTPLGKNYKINYELQTTITYKEAFMEAKKVVVDGSVCDVVSVIPAGIGDITQINVYAGAV